MRKLCESYASLGAKARPAVPHRCRQGQPSVQLKKMQQLQDDIRKAQEKVNQETLIYQQKVLDQTEDPDPVDLVLKALGMTGGLTDAQLTEEQKRRLEAIKEEEAKRRRVQVVPAGLGTQQSGSEFQPLGLDNQQDTKATQPHGLEDKGRDLRSIPQEVPGAPLFWTPFGFLCGRPSMGWEGECPEPAPPYHLCQICAVNLQHSSSLHQGVCRACLSPDRSVFGQHTSP